MSHIKVCLTLFSLVKWWSKKVRGVGGLCVNVGWVHALEVRAMLDRLVCNAAHSSARFSHLPLSPEVWFLLKIVFFCRLTNTMYVVQHNDSPCKSCVALAAAEPAQNPALVSASKTSTLKTSKAPATN